MSWRPAPAVSAALGEATRRWPKRSRKSDGTVSSERHKKQNPKSDHDPDERGVVLALDLTHDPANGCDAHELVRAAVARRDPRIKYAISQDRIWSKKRAAEGWRPYMPRNPGRNRHDKHAHISVDRAHEDDTSPWWPPLPALRRAEEDDVKPPPTIRIGSRDRRTVLKLQALLKIPHGHPEIEPHGQFTVALQSIVMDHQRFHGLADDGVVGPDTWRTLIEK